MLHELKASSPISFKLSGKFIVDRWEAKKALFPILVTVDGTVNDESG
jgi:hypothetical protein